MNFTTRQPVDSVASWGHLNANTYARRRRDLWGYTGCMKGTGGYIGMKIKVYKDFTGFELPNPGGGGEIQGMMANRMETKMDN